MPACPIWSIGTATVLHLDRGIAQVLQIAPVFRAVLFADRGKMNALAGGAGLQSRPRVDQLLVDRIELVGPRPHGLQPVPLGHARFQASGRRIGVVLQQLGSAGAVVAQIHASEQRKACAVAPLERREAALDRRHQIGRNPELPIALLLDHVARRVERALVQFGARRLEVIDLLGPEAVTTAFVPVHAVDRVISESERFHLLLPAFARRQKLPAHHPSRPKKWADEPKPPREGTDCSIA
jgi:hypothetical protein